MAERQSLEGRITGALRNIERTDAARRRSKTDLESTLARLEQRFNVRIQELEHVRSRYYALTDANREVEACIERLARLADNASTEAADASATLTLQLRSEMLSTDDRFEDVTQDELDAEDTERESNETLDIPTVAQRGKRQRQH